MARYVYYCAARGLDTIPVPKDPRSVLLEFEADLEGWWKLIIEEINSISDNEKYRKKLISICARKARYPMLDSGYK
ncbi:hypothetical protein [Caldiplasma sukawensis]